MKCKYCGEEFGRLDRYGRRRQEVYGRPRLFCSDSCRVNWHRRADSLNHAIDRAMSNLQTVRSSVKRHPDLMPALLPRLNRLKDEINDLLLLCRDPERQQLMNMLYERSARICNAPVGNESAGAKSLQPGRNDNSGGDDDV